MISARLVKFGLFAFVAVAILALVLTFFNPFAQPAAQKNISPTRVAIATRVANSVAATSLPPNTSVAEPTAPPPTEEAVVPVPTIPANSSAAFQQALTQDRKSVV